MRSMYEFIDEGILKILNDLGKTIVSIWKAQAPVRTGNLRDSIGYDIIGAQGQYTLTFHYLYYGVYVDVGTLQNKDASAYGMSPFEMPPYNARPQKRLGGIVPRYWTSLSERTESIDRQLDDAMSELFDKTFDQFIEEINAKIQRLKGQ